MKAAEATQDVRTHKATFNAPAVGPNIGRSYIRLTGHQLTGMLSEDLYAVRLAAATFAKTAGCGGYSAVTLFTLLMIAPFNASMTRSRSAVPLAA